MWILEAMVGDGAVHHHQEHIGHICLAHVVILWMDFQSALTKTGLFACRGRDNDQKLNDMAACQNQLVDADSNVLSIQPL